MSIDDIEDSGDEAPAPDADFPPEFQQPGLYSSLYQEGFSMDLLDQLFGPAQTDIPLTGPPMTHTQEAGPSQPGPYYADPTQFSQPSYADPSQFSQPSYPDPSQFSQAGHGFDPYAHYAAGMGYVGHPAVRGQPPIEGHQEIVEEEEDEETPLSTPCLARARGRRNPNPPNKYTPSDPTRRGADM